MKNLKRICTLISVLVLCFSITACKETKQEKSYISVNSSKAALDKQDLLQRAHIVVKGKVVSKNFEVMTNPDGTSKDSKGNVIVNRQIAEYTVDIDKLYKGEYDGDTIKVMTHNGYGLSPDLILYGEDDKNILATPLERTDLDVGKECILLLMYVDDVSEGYEGYYPVAKSKGYYPLDETGKYVCKVSDSLDDYSFSLDAIEQEIADVELTVENDQTTE